MRPRESDLGRSAVETVRVDRVNRRAYTQRRIGHAKGGFERTTDDRSGVAGVRIAGGDARIPQRGRLQPEIATLRVRAVRAPPGPAYATPSQLARGHRIRTPQLGRTAFARLLAGECRRRVLAPRGAWAAGRAGLLLGTVPRRVLHLDLRPS